MGFAVPESIGPYLILDRLGVGGMGLVYRAHHREDSVEVALKVISPFGADAEMAVKRFHRESKIHQNLSHPNLVRVIDSGLDGDVPYLVMELIRGRALSEI